MKHIKLTEEKRLALIEEGEKIVSTNDDPVYLNRVVSVNLMLKGCKTSFVSESSGKHPKTLLRWKKIVVTKGFEAIRFNTKHLGRHSKLSEVQESEIKSAIMSDPSNYSYNVWDGISLSDYIKRRYGIELSVRQCQRLFHKLGFSRIRPQVFPSKDHENDKTREEFKKKSKN